MTKFHEHQIVELNQECFGLPKGTRGTIVHLYGRDSCEVEFSARGSARVFTVPFVYLQPVSRKYHNDSRFEASMVLLYYWSQAWHKQAGGYTASDTANLLMRVESYINEMIDNNPELECFRPS